MNVRLLFVTGWTSLGPSHTHTPLRLGCDRGPRPEKTRPGPYLSPPSFLPHLGPPEQEGTPLGRRRESPRPPSYGRRGRTPGTTTPTWTDSSWTSGGADRPICASSSRGVETRRTNRSAADTGVPSVARVPPRPGLPVSSSVLTPPSCVPTSPGPKRSRLRPGRDRTEKSGRVREGGGGMSGSRTGSGR